MTEARFVHLHSHTHYSVKDAAMTVERYVKAVKALGMDACALTEHGNMHSALEFYNACKKEGLKPIIGVEAYILPRCEMAESEDPTLRSTKHHLVLLAKDEVGYRQLCKAVTKSYLLQDSSASGIGVFPRMTYDDLREHFVGGHVIALSGCVFGELSVTLLTDGYEEARKKALLYQSIFGSGNYYIEIQNHGFAEELKALPDLIRLGRETGIPLVATNDCHYAEKADSRLRDIMVASRFKGTVNDPKFDADCGELYVKSPEAMAELFKDVPEAIANSVKIADQCSISFTKGKHFPHFKTPEGMSEDEYLRKLTFEGLYRKYPDFDSRDEAWKKTRLDRIEYELDVIGKTKYAGYLLIVADFTSYGRSVGLIGRGRGSAVGSYVCYLLGIVEVDPLDFDLLFERFLNLDRVSDPDIDTDFDETRGDVLKYVSSVYGENAVCHIISFGTLGAKSAIRFVGRHTSKPESLCDKLAKMVPARPNVTLEAALTEVPELRAEYDTDPMAKEIIDTALAMEGLVDKTSVHAAGVIIGDRELSDYMPLMYDKDNDQWVSQFDMNYCQDDCGLLKMDFLGLSNLTIIKRTLADIERVRGVRLALDTILYDDKDVIREIFARGRTKGVFQFESAGMVNMLRRFQPTTLEDLILLNAAFRPGPLQYLDAIIETKHGKQMPRYICRGMEEILGVTYGKPIYQEQIMAIFNKIAGFSLGVGDIIRRAMAKKDEEKLKKYLPDFKAGLVKAGATPEDADQFCEEVKEFSKYAFNKSHAAAYAVTAYITAYLKYHYPVEYMANLLNVAKIEDIPLYIKEAREMGIRILPPSVNESGEMFTPTKAGAIRFGLGRIKGLGKACRDTIVEREANGPFKDFADFVGRMARNGRNLNKKIVVSLAQTGGFDDFGVSRRQVAESCDEYIDLVRKSSIRESELLDVRRRMEGFVFPASVEGKPEGDAQQQLFAMAADGLIHVDTSAKGLGLPKSVRDAVSAEENQGGGFRDLRDFIDRVATHDCGLTKKCVAALIERGLFDGCNARRDELAEVAGEYLGLYRELARKQTSFEQAKVALEAFTFPPLDEYDSTQLLGFERELLGFYASGHPLLEYRQLLAEKADMEIAELTEDMDQRFVTLCGQVTDFTLLRRREDGAAMCKFVLEDLSGQIPTVVFAKAYAEHKDNISNGAVVSVRGRVKAELRNEDDEEKREVRIELLGYEVSPLMEAEKVYIKLKTRDEWSRAKEVLSKHIGASPLLVYVESEKTVLKVTSFAVKVSDEMRRDVEAAFGPGHVATK